MEDNTHTETDPYELNKLPVEMWPVERIHEYPRNNKIHSQADIEKMKASIRQFGLFDALIVDIDGVLIAGHKRFRSLRELGHVEFPVKWAKHLSKNQADAARIAHNKTVSSEYDSGFMALELERLATAEDVDLGSLGLDLHELDFLTGDLGAINPDGLAQDLDAEIDAQEAETAQKVDAIDGAQTPIAKVLGFKSVPVGSELLFKRFVTEIEADTGKIGLPAWVEWLNARAA